MSYTWGGVQRSHFKNDFWLFIIGRVTATNIVIIDLIIFHVLKIWKKKNSFLVNRCTNFDKFLFFELLFVYLVLMRFFKLLG